MAARSLEAGWWAYARGIEAGAHGFAAGHHAFRIDVIADHRDVLSAAAERTRNARAWSGVYAAWLRVQFSADREPHRLDRAGADEPTTA